jgi:DegV family protein with EDD domain
VDEVSVITDSIACLPNGLVEEYGINIVPYSFSIDSRSYRDWVDITPTQAYELFLADPESFYTAPASPADYLAAYRELGQRVRDIICITVSARLSTAYNVARMAAEQVREEIPGLTIAVVDSWTATAAEGFVALAAARAAAAGRGLAEVVKAAESVRDRISLVALLDTVRYVYRSGRIPEIAARAGSKLGIRPLLTISGGVVRIVNMGRDKRRSLERLLDFMKKRIGDNPVHVAVMHAFAPEDAERLRQRVATEFNCVELWLTEFSPLMGYACGTGTLGVAYYI